jgi:hypothetical protein
MRTRRRKIAMIALVTVATYLAAYVPLTLLGSYQPDMTGRRRYSSGLAMMDAKYWQPAGMYFRKYIGVSGKTDCSGDVLGSLYAPLILLDRAIWHHDHSWDDSLKQETSSAAPEPPATTSAPAG